MSVAALGWQYSKFNKKSARTVDHDNIAIDIDEDDGYRYEDVIEEEDGHEGHDHEEPDGHDH